MSAGLARDGSEGLAQKSCSRRRTRSEPDLFGPGIITETPKDNVLLAPIHDPIGGLDQVEEGHKMLQLVVFLVCVKAAGYDSSALVVRDVEPIAGKRALPAD